MSIMEFKRKFQFSRLILASAVVILAAGMAAAWLSAGTKPARAQDSAQPQYPQSMFQEMRWRNIGPYQSSRTRAVAGVPGQPSVFYIGQVTAACGNPTMTADLESHF